MNTSSPLLPFATIDHRARRGQVFGILADDVLRHVAIIGKTGSGKSVLLENLIVADLEAGRGLALLDPHGDLALRVLAALPRRRKNDMRYIDPADPAHPFGMNLLAPVPVELRGRVASGVLGAFRKAYGDFWGPRLEHVFRNALLALLEVRGATLMDVPRLLLEDDRREWVLRQVKDPIVRHFWLVEFPSYGKFAVEAASPVLNKVGAVLASPVLRRIVGQTKNTIDFRRLMDRGGVLLANLAKGRMGESESALLGALLLAQLQLAAYSRADVALDERRAFHLYVDEVGSFATGALGDLLAEARKFGLGVVMACQYLGQLDERLRDAVLGNAGTLICFRLGAEDAKLIGEEFEAEITARDLMRLGEHQIALRLSAGGLTTAPFTATTLAPRSAMRSGRRP